MDTSLVENDAEVQVEVIKNESVMNKNIVKDIPKDWNTDPLPHVQIGLHTVGNESVIKVENIENKNISSKSDQEILLKNVQAILPGDLVDFPVTASIQNISDNIKKFTNEERNLVKSNKNAAIQYLKQKANYQNVLGSASKDEKKTDQRINKMFKKSLEIVSKNDSKPMTYAKLATKLSKMNQVKKLIYLQTLGSKKLY
jgi:transcriptional regulator with GAF, ATPase, and Fis domain